jgi:sulfur carrier protein ThiS adenylyltransferase
MISKEEISSALGKGLTQAQLNALHNARVGIVGLGGLGSNIAVALTRLGVSNLYLYDFDKVELSNLNRQYYFLDDVGEYKANALAKHLRRINPCAALHSQVIKVTEDNIPALLGDCDIICEALDNAAGKAMLVSTVLSTWSDKKVIAGSGIAGFGKAEEITSKKITKNLYLCGDGSSDFHNLPLCGARVALCAMQQALLAARIILDLEEN